MRDRLFLLESQFADPALPGRAFYCRDCITIEGLLAAFPERAANIEVIRFANEIEALLAALHTRHGFPERHP